MRLINYLCLAALLCASAVLAQSGEAESADTVPSQNLGNSQLVAQNMMATLRIENAKRYLCWRLGCLVVANESRSYKVTGFFVLMPDMLGTDRWGVNQFDQQLPARSTALQDLRGRRLRLARALHPHPLIYARDDRSTQPRQPLRDSVQGLATPPQGVRTNHKRHRRRLIPRSPPG